MESETIAAVASVPVWAANGCGGAMRCDAMGVEF